MKLRLPLSIAEHFSGSKRIYWRLWTVVAVILPGSAALWSLA